MNRRALLVGGTSVAALPLTAASTAFVPDRLFVRDFIGTQRGLDLMKATVKQLPPDFLADQMKILRSFKNPYAA